MYKPLGVIVVVAAMASVSVGHTMARGIVSDLELSHERFYAIRAEIRQTPDAVIVLGDSIVQGAPLPKWICGYAVINAEVVGAAVEYFERHSAELLGSSRPRLIVLAVGIKDASPKMAKQISVTLSKNRRLPFPRRTRNPLLLRMALRAAFL
jgi:hypothetical protein